MKISLIKNFISKYWLFVLIVLQPLLDVIAFFSSSNESTIAGYFRLLTMIVLVVIVFFKEKNNRRFLLAFSVIVIIYGLHVLNCIRVGYINPKDDIIYMAKVAYMPVLALCFCCFIKNKADAELCINSIFINFIIVFCVIIISYITKTYTPTYDGPIGISGWVIDDNRCCHSDILATLCIFASYVAVKSNNKLLNIIVPFVVFTLLISNGTKACYLTVFAISAGYPLFLGFEHIIKKEKFDFRQILICIVFVFIFISSIIIYPFSPRYKVDHRENSYLQSVEQKFAEDMKNYGYDIYNVNPDDIENDQFLKECFSDYYLHRIYGSLPVLVETYGTDRIMKSLNYTVDSTYLEDTREMKKLYASFIFEDSDTLTKLFGFEFSKLGDDKSVDLENDWFAIFYYYGYLAIIAYLGLIVYFVIRVLRVCKADFSNQLNILNFTLVLCFIIQLGLGYFSGAMLRRPNASIYLSLVIALLYYRTDLSKIRGKRLKYEAFNNYSSL